MRTRRSRTHPVLWGLALAVAAGPLLQCQDRKPSAPGPAARAKQLAQTARHAETASRRESAVVALGRLGRTESIGVLVEAARKDTEPNVRRRAVSALGRIHDARAATALGHLWRTPRSPQDRVHNIAVQQALIHLGPLALPALRRSLAHGSDRVRSRAVWALQQIGNPAAIAALRPLLSDPSPTVRDDAKQALRALQARPRPRSRPRPRPRRNSH